MKLQGSLKDLVKVGDNKRGQLPPPSAPVQSQPQLQQQPGQAGRKRVAPKDTVFVPTRLLLPEEVKMDLDRLFLDHKKELGGKNQFMIDAIQKGIAEFKKKVTK